MDATKAGVRPCEGMGNELFAQHNIDAKEEIITLNGSSEYLMGLNDEDFDEINVSAHCLLVLRLLEEMAKGDKSLFYNYISSLPSTIPLPIVWTQKEKSDLHGTTA